MLNLKHVMHRALPSQRVEISFEKISSLGDKIHHLNVDEAHDVTVTPYGFMIGAFEDCTTCVASSDDMEAGRPSKPAGSMLLKN